MTSKYQFGLLTCFLLTLSISTSYSAPKNISSSSYYEDDYDQYEDYYDENETNDAKDINAINRLNSETPVTPTTNRISLFPKRKDVQPNHINNAFEVITPKCPKACICLENKYLQCSNAGLGSVPDDLPSTVHILNLSNNNITRISAADFANLTKLIEINLSSNHLQELEEDSFANFRNLLRLNMSNNQLSDINPDLFAAAKELRTLDLSNNQIKLPADKSFLNQPNLLELQCRNCSWDQLYDNTFQNMSSLTTLKLDLNNFSKKINTNAFIPLKSLLKLKLPDLDQNSIKELCNLLKSIDNISFKHFDITCFELVLGTSFNESLILATDPPNIKPNTTKEITTNIKNMNITVQKTNENLFNASSKTNESNLVLEENSENVKPTNDSILVANVSGADTNNDDGTYQVAVSQKTINIMLISIMTIALIGLLVGVLFRKDICGIKTKCCRSSKDEQKNEVPKPEEIPLNKINRE